MTLIVISAQGQVFISKQHCYSLRQRLIGSFSQGVRE